MHTAALRARLQGHQPADREEAEHRGRMLDLLDSPAPFARSQTAPGHFTASAFVLSPDGGSVLLIYHSKLHLWLQPGGHVDPTDSDIIAAALREVAEETHLTAVEMIGEGLFDLDIHRIPENPKRGEPAHEHFDVRVLLRSATLDFKADSDALDARWVPLDAFGTDPSLQTDASVMRAIGKVRALG